MGWKFEPKIAFWGTISPCKLEKAVKICLHDRKILSLLSIKILSVFLQGPPDSPFLLSLFYKKGKHFFLSFFSHASHHSYPSHPSDPQSWTKVLGHFCVSGVFFNSHRSDPSPHPTNYVGRMYPEFFLSFNFV